MKVALFYHSLISDWNNGNAHFLRGIATELLRRGHQIEIYEPHDGWGAHNPVGDPGRAPRADFHRAYPTLSSTTYRLESLDLDRMLDGADLVIVHERNEPALVKRIGDHRRLGTGYKLLFHDTHHRSVSRPERTGAFDLSHYDGLLAFGEVVRERYLSNGWIQTAWVWHQAADTNVFFPRAGVERSGDLVWVGNWGDDERTAELHDFLFEPSLTLGLRTDVYGAGYPSEVLDYFRSAGIRFGGWIPNFTVPEVFGRFAVTVDIPRRTYTETLRGTPTIRPFEALACGIPLVCAMWEDTERLFTPGKDYLLVHSGEEMHRALYAILSDRKLARGLAEHGRRTVLERHTCGHRVEQLLGIARQIGVQAAPECRNPGKGGAEGARG